MNTGCFTMNIFIYFFKPIKNEHDKENGKQKKKENEKKGAGVQG